MPRLNGLSGVRAVVAAELARFAAGVGRVATAKNLKLAAPERQSFRIAATTTAMTQATRVIGVIPRQLLTEHLTLTLPVVDGEVRDESGDFALMLMKLRALPQPTVALVHGVAVAGGMGLQRGIERSADVLQRGGTGGEAAAAEAARLRGETVVPAVPDG